MTTTSPVQKILKGVLYREEEDKCKQDTGKNRSH
jgi:hypothetical protein